MKKKYKGFTSELVLFVCSKRVKNNNMNKYRPLGAMGYLYGFDNTSSRLQFRLKDLLNRLL